MKPYFADLSSFFAMGEHGTYVWACFGIVVITVLWAIVYTKNERKRVIKQLRLRQKRQR